MNSTNSKPNRTEMFQTEMLNSDWNRKELVCGWWMWCIDRVHVFSICRISHISRIARLSRVLDPLRQMIICSVSDVILIPFYRFVFILGAGEFEWRYPAPHSAVKSALTDLFFPKCGKWTLLNPLRATISCIHFLNFACDLSSFVLFLVLVTKRQVDLELFVINSLDWNLHPSFG